MLKAVLREPIVVLVRGDWRSGKTNNSLLFAYLARKWGIVDEIGTNIKLKGKAREDIALIENTGHLKAWMHQNAKEKIFILDEALKALYRRNAMSKLSVKIISDIMPEVSKGHCRLLALTQIDSLDSDLLHPAFHRATWTCTKKGVMQCRSKHYPFREYTDLPKSPIHYDPDKLAKFIDKEVYKIGDKSKRAVILNVAEMYSNKRNMGKIAKELGIHRQEVKRHLQKALKWFVDNYQDKELAVTK